MKVHPRARQALDLIGVPEKTEFVPDPFQEEAVAKIERGDVIVTAPTGSGKTWIATTIMEKMLSEGKRIWYAAPLKALSNILYADFGRMYGTERVGILTGDRKENSNASVVVGTTEILRNHLYDAMHHGEDLPVDLVVLDEAHYLGDEDRGMVWEEVMIYLPPRIRLLLLSATIENSAEISSWLERNRGVPCTVVASFKRSVPLYPLFLFPYGEVVPLKSRRELNPAVERYEEQEKSKRRRFGRQDVNFGTILEQLRELDLLPAIFFLKSRADCNRALLTCRHSSPFTMAQRKESEEKLHQLLEAYPFLKDHPQLHHMRQCRVASHHAGQLPYWKILVERMMKAGQLDAIFSTSTVAAGVNFPARTVVILQSDRFNGREFADLSSTELHQMLGRAGRRGMDHIGFAVVIPGPFQNPKLIASLLDSPPDPVMSRMRVNFSMTLNLLLSHDPADIRRVFELSFATYQGAPEMGALDKELKRLKKTLSPMLDGAECDSVDTLLDTTIQRQDLDESVRKIDYLLRRDREIFFALTHMTRGRLFLTTQGNLYCALGRLDPDTLQVPAAKVKQRVKVRSTGVKFRDINLERIRFILDFRLDLPSDDEPDEIARLISDAAGGEYEELDPRSRISPERQQRLDSLEAQREALLKEKKTLPCRGCTQAQACLKKKDAEVRRALGQAIQLARSVSRFRDRLWKEFLRHFEFIVQEGYADTPGTLSPKGRWAANLRIDQPLMVAQGIRESVFPHDSPEILAGLMALFVAERSSDLESATKLLEGEGKLAEACTRVSEAVAPLRTRLQQAGFDVPPMPFSAALTLYRWARGMDWDRLVELSGLDEGDLAMLIYRTADHLRQLEGLRETHPQLSNAAAEATSQVLRDQVAPF